MLNFIITYSLYLLVFNCRSIHTVFFADLPGIPLELPCLITFYDVVFVLVPPVAFIFIVIVCMLLIFIFFCMWCRKKRFRCLYHKTEAVFIVSEQKQ